MSHENDRNGDEHAKQYDQTEVGIQNTGDGQRPGSGRHKHMRGVQTHCQRNGHSGHAYLGISSHALCKRGQQNICRVAEYGDRDKITCEGKTERGVLFTRYFQYGLCHGLGGSAFFEQCTHNGADRNDYAYSGNRSAEAVCIGGHNVVDVVPHHKTEGNSCGGKSKEGMKLDLDGQKYEKCN